MSLFGLQTHRQSSEVIIIPAPWDVTTSYSEGTHQGPESILKASPQIDLYDIEFKEAWKAGFHLETADAFFQKNESCRAIAKKIIKEWDQVGKLSEETKNLVKTVNATTREMVQKIAELSQQVFKRE